jgi:enediyne biosynthesis thioesterase
MPPDSAAAAAAPGPTRRGFSYVHVVGFEETNLVGNVYFARHVAWQGRCRELFLKEHAPEILRDLAGDLRLVTLKASCEYFEEVRAFDTIEVHMALAHIVQNRIGLDFEYRRQSVTSRTTVALGFQEIACMKAASAGMVVVPLPAALERALLPFRRQPGEPRNSRTHGAPPIDR